MKKIVLQFVAVAAVSAVASSWSMAANLAADFDVSANPGNGWTFGFNDVGVGGGNDMANDITFGLFHPNSAGNAGDRWTGDGTGNENYPPNDLMLVNLGSGNTEGDHWGGGVIKWDTGVSYHTWGNSALSGGINGLSGDDMIFSTYTIPANGLYDVIGTWTENGNQGGATVDVLVNGVSLGASSIDLDTPGSSTTIQSLGVALSSGDTVSFRTLRDLDYQFGGSARLDASVAPVPEPAVVALAGLALAAAACGLRRR